MNNLKIGTRLIMGFGLVLLLMAALVIVGTVRLTSIDEAATGMVEKEWVKADAANTINVLTRANARRNMELLLLTDPARLAEARKDIESNKKAITEQLEVLDKLVYTPGGKAILARIKEERARYVASFTKVGQLGAQEQLDEARKTMMGETLPLLDKLQESVKELAELQKTLTADRAGHIRQDIDFTRNLLLALGLAATAIGLGWSWRVARSITRPLKEAVDVAQRVARGDLSGRIEITGKDEAGQLLLALKDMNDALANIVGEVRGGAENIASASHQIASGNTDLAARTEEQAGSLQETASSMEELTSTVKQNAGNAQQANQLAQAASDVAVKGGAVVSEVVQTMGSINESAKRIAEIIGVIDGIAFQTNILALNAAVEAARAGEQGRGFAVVASEVRNLAQRSAAAAKEIKALIDSSVAKVDAGSRLVDQAGMTMQEVVQAIHQVTDIMADITAASLEQTAGIEQVRLAVVQMDQVTQQNASLVEEAAAASESLSEQADTLAQAVKVFRLHGTPVLTPVTTAKVVRLPKKALLSVTTADESSRVKQLGSGWTEF